MSTSRFLKIARVLIVGLPSVARDSGLKPTLQLSQWKENAMKRFVGSEK